MKKRVSFIFFALLVTCGFSQGNDNNAITNKNLSIELNAGKLFSPFRYYQNHSGYENLWLGVSKNLTEHYGLQVAQSYGRLYSERTNNLTMVFNTILSPTINFFTDKKISLRIAAGSGITLISTKCLYEEYPVKELYTAVPVRLNLGGFYKLNDRLSLDLNLDATFSWMLSYKTHNLIINDSFYYKTFFFSTNIGLVYKIIKKSPNGF